MTQWTDGMLVRIVVRLEDCALVRRLVHATPYEPDTIDPEKGVLEFNVPFRRAVAVVNRLAESSVGCFSAHLVSCL